MIVGMAIIGHWLAGRIEDGYRSRVEPLPVPTRRLLLVAAAEPVGDPGLVWRAAGVLGVGFDAGSWWWKTTSPRRYVLRRASERTARTSSCGIPASSCHCICHKGYTCCVARDDDASSPAS